MVVTSANNRAVENISTEIPAPAPPSALSGGRGATTSPSRPPSSLAGSPAWGAVAARLGSKNHIEFVNRFWNDKEKATDAHVIATVPRAGAKSNAWLDSGSGLAQLLRKYIGTPQEGV